MVGMQHHRHQPGRTRQVGEASGRHPVRQQRQAGVDAPRRAGADAAPGGGQFGGTSPWRPATGSPPEDHLVDVGAWADDQGHRLAVSRGAAVPRHRGMLAEAVAAMHRAAAGGDQQGAPVAFVDHPSRRAGRPHADRVGQTGDAMPSVQHQQHLRSKGSAGRRGACGRRTLRQPGNWAATALGNGGSQRVQAHPPTVRAGSRTASRHGLALFGAGAVC